MFSGLVIVLGVLTVGADGSTLSVEQIESGSSINYYFTHSSGEAKMAEEEVNLKEFNKLPSGTSLFIKQTSQFDLMIASRWQELQKNYLIGKNFIKKDKFKVEAEGAVTYLLYPFVVTRKSSDTIEKMVLGFTEYGDEKQKDQIPERTALTVDASHKDGETTLVFSQIATGEKCEGCTFSVSFGDKPISSQRILAGKEGDGLVRKKTTLNLNFEEEEEGDDKEEYDREEKEEDDKKGKDEDEEKEEEEDPIDPQQGQNQGGSFGTLSGSMDWDAVESEIKVDGGSKNIKGPKITGSTTLNFEAGEVEISPDSKEGHDRVEAKFKSFEKVVVNCLTNNKVDLATFPFNVAPLASAFYFCEHASKVAVRLYKQDKTLFVDIIEVEDGQQKLLI